MSPPRRLRVGHHQTWIGSAAGVLAAAGEASSATAAAEEGAGEEAWAVSETEAGGSEASGVSGSEVGAATAEEATEVGVALGSVAASGEEETA